MQTSNAEPIELVTARLVRDAAAVERDIHRGLASAKAKGGREWFKLEPAEVIDLAVRLNQNDEVAIADYVVETVKGQLERIVKTYESKIEEADADTLAPVTTPPRVSYDVVDSKKRTFDQDVETAVEIVRQSGRASTSLLQRTMKIGYSRAARIMDELERSLIISGPDGNHARTVYY